MIRLKAFSISRTPKLLGLHHLAVLRPGDHLLASEWIYGGTRRLFTEDHRLVRIARAAS